MTTRGSPELSFAEKPTLRGERVLLRPMTVGDAPAMYAGLDDPELIQLTGTHADFTPAQLESWAASRGQHDDRLDLAVVDAASGDFVGEVVLMDLDSDNRSCSFRIAIGGAHLRGRGLGTEATRLILAHAFETVGVHRVSLEVYAFNPRARRVYEKVGFVTEGTMRQALLWDGQWVDAHLMSALAPEWDDHHGHPEQGGG